MIWLRLAPWAALALAGLALWGLWGRLDAAETRLAASEAIVRQKQADAALSAELLSHQAAALTALSIKATTQVQQVYNVPITRDCAQSPAMRAGSRGVRELFGAGEPPAGR